MKISKNNIWTDRLWLAEKYLGFSEYYLKEYIYICSNFDPSMSRSREFCAAAAKQFDNFPCAQANRKNHELKKSDVLTKNI